MASSKKVSVNSRLCPQNHPCPVAGRCPHGAIKQKNAFSAPEIIKEKCVDCGLCTKFCRVFQAIPA